MPFLTKLDVEYRREEPKYKWLLLADLVYVSSYLDTPIVVEKGFSTDFASVPRIPFAYWLAGGIAQEAATIHDYLYWKKIVPKDIADKIFLEAMEETGISKWRRVPMYWAVKYFGGKAWDEKPQ